MARKPAPGEKVLYWIGSSYAELVMFPEAVKDEIGAALGVAQFGGRHPSTKPWRGEGPGVVEIVENYGGNTYRAVYTVRFARAVDVLHAFRRSRPRALRLQGRMSN